MSPDTAHPPLDALLQHPALWRGRGAAQQAGHSTGFPALDAALPGGGWPRRGLIEVLTDGSGHGELALWLPLLSRLTQSATARWSAFIAPPFELFAPVWQAEGVRVDRLLVARAAEPLWALEQALLSGACALGFAWLRDADMTALRRLVLATERGDSLGVLIRPPCVQRAPSAAVLRLALVRGPACLKVQLLKGRGVFPRTVELPLP